MQKIKKLFAKYRLCIAFVSISMNAFGGDFFIGLAVDGKNNNYKFTNNNNQNIKRFNGYSYNNQGGRTNSVPFYEQYPTISSIFTGISSGAVLGAVAVLSSKNTIFYRNPISTIASSTMFFGTLPLTYPYLASAGTPLYNAGEYLINETGTLLNSAYNSTATNIQAINFTAHALDALSMTGNALYYGGKYTLKGTGYALQGTGYVLQRTGGYVSNEVSGYVLHDASFKSKNIGYVLHESGSLLYNAGSFFNLDASNVICYACEFTLKGTGYAFDGVGYAFDGVGYAFDGVGYALKVSGYVLQGTGYALDGAGYLLKGESLANSDYSNVTNHSIENQIIQYSNSLAIANDSIPDEYLFNGGGSLSHLIQGKITQSSDGFEIADNSAQNANESGLLTPSIQPSNSLEIADNAVQNKNRSELLSYLIENNLIQYSNGVIIVDTSLYNTNGGELLNNLIQSSNGFEIADNSVYNAGEYLLNGGESLNNLIQSSNGVEIADNSVHNTGESLLNGSEVFNVNQSSNGVEIADNTPHLHNPQQSASGFASSISFIGGYRASFGQNFGSITELGLDINTIGSKFGSNHKDEIELRNNFHFYLMQKIGYSFKDNILTYITLGVGIQDTKLMYKNVINTKKYTTNIILGVGNEFKVMNKLGVFAEFNNIISLNNIHTSIGEVKTSSYQMKFGARYYL